VDRTGDCWIWHGERTFANAPYRIAYALMVGPVPAGMLICHHCDNRMCVRPDHLFLGTAQDNIRDMWAKGRANPHGGAPHTPERYPAEYERAMSIRQVIEAEPLAGYEELASRFGVGWRIVSQIAMGTHWSVRGQPALRRGRDWSDPEFRARHRAGNAKFWASPAGDAVRLHRRQTSGHALEPSSE